jgi:hypothetical protein
VSNAAVKDLIDNGVARFKLDQPWISAKENKMVCGGFGIGCEVVCCRMLGRNEALFLRIEMATFSCTNTRKDALRIHQASRQHQKSVLEELGVPVGPNGNPLVGALPFEVFSGVCQTADRDACQKDRPGRHKGPAQERQVLFAGSQAGNGQGFHEE